MTARTPRISILVAPALLWACGGGGDPGSGPDGGTSGGDDAGGVGGDGPPYESPLDFERHGCSGGVGEVDPTGIWHMELEFDSGAAAVGELGGEDGGFLAGAADAPGGLLHEDGGGYVVADVLRVDSAAGGALDAYLFGTAVDEVSHTDSDLFLRHVYEGRDGSQIERAWDACAVIAGGGLFGRYANCRGDSCLVGTFEAHRLDPLDEPVASGLSEVAVYGGPEASPWPVDAIEGQITANAQVQGDIAYVARYYDGLRVVDVSDPGGPAELAHVPVSDPGAEFFNDVKVVSADGGDYAIAASSARGAVVFDVTDPANPEEVATIPSAEGADVHSIFIDGTEAYLANLSTGGIDIFDATDPSAPERLGRYVDEAVASGNDFVHDLHVAGGRAYLNYWNLGLVVVDVSDPTSPVRVGAYDGYSPRTSHANWVTEAGGRLVSVHGDEGFGAHVRIVDVDDGSGEFLEEIGSYQTRQQVSVHNIVADGELAYVSYYQDGLRVLDLSDPTAPAEIAHYQTWPGAEPGYGFTFFEGAIGVDVDSLSGRVFVADTHRGLVILDLD